MSEIAISVIIPIYNMEKYLKACLDSVIEQTLKNIEIICINDGSTDHTKEILDSYKYLDRIKIIEQENLGASIARNRGIEIAQGEFLAFIDPDDFYPENDVLEYLYNNAKKEKVDICGGGQCHLIEGRIRYDYNILPIFEKKQMIDYRDYQFAFGYMRYIYRSELINSHAIRFPNYKRYQDPLFLVKAMMAAEKILGIPKIVYCARYVDKVINYSDGEVIFGHCYGIGEIMEIAEKSNMKILFESMWNDLKKQYLDSLYRGVLDEKPAAIRAYEYILQINKRGYFEEMDILSGEDLIEYAKKQFDKSNYFVNEIMNATSVIIYGAREKAKRIYDCIHEKIEKEKKVDFVVSDLKDRTTTARGIQLKSLDDILNEGQLVILAVSLEAESFVKENLYKKGFNKIITVDVGTLEFVNYQ